MRYSTVLIETLWNVKWKMNQFQQQPVQSINRNIVECKVEKDEEMNRLVYCINRNIVECKEQ